MSRIFILYLLSLTLRSLLLAAFAGIAMSATRKVQVRHAAWTIVLGCLLLMPVADTLLPEAFVPPTVPEIVSPIKTLIVYAPTPASSTLYPSNSPTFESEMDWWQTAAILSIAIAAVMLIRFTLVMRAVVRLRKNSRPVSTQLWKGSGDVSILESGSVSVPITIGFRKPSLILPLEWRDWDEWKLRAVLTHEQTHVQRRDWTIAALASFAKCIYWFNPLVWWLEKKLSSLAEQASDEACVRSCGDPPRYAETLLEFASTAKHGHRWIGGVAMARLNISLRIERILALRRPGPGILRRTGWVALALLGIPALYVSAAAQSAQTGPLAISAAEIREIFEPRTAIPEQPAMAFAQQPAPPPQPQENRPPVVPVTPSPGTTPSVAPAVPGNPDLVGEIRLILAPVDAQSPAQPGTVEAIRNGTRYTGTAVWNVRNAGQAPNLWISNAVWTPNSNAFVFAVTGLDSRKILFEEPTGRTFSYGCTNCSVLVWESGVGVPAASAEPGIIFRLSDDRKSLSVTCRAAECRMGVSGNSTLVSPALRNSESRDVALFHSTNGQTCFSVLGTLKPDGTPFTDADCGAGNLMSPTVFFMVTRQP